MGFFDRLFEEDDCDVDFTKRDARRASDQDLLRLVDIKEGKAKRIYKEEAKRRGLL